MSFFAPILRQPTLRLIAVALLLLGVHNGSVYPYQSLIAIERIGLSKPGFALLLVIASAVTVTSSVLFGILGDQFGHRRRIALAAAFASTIGIAAMLFAPGIWALVLCQGFLLPVAASLYGQLFALARLASTEAGRARDATLGKVRAAMSVSFLATLLLLSVVFATGSDVMAVYLTGGFASLAMSLLLYVRWPKDGATDWEDKRSGLGLRQSFIDIGRPYILIRLGLLGALATAGNLYMILISLVFEASAVRDTSDVALYIGLVAGFEIPAMLILPQVTRHLGRASVIAVAAAVYCCHLLALPWLSDTPFIWGFAVLGGLGGAAMITVPILYYQDLMQGRPGTAGAMLSLQKLISDMLTAAIFAIGTLIGGFETVAIMGVAVALCGAVGLYLADRQSWLLARI